MHKAVVTMKLTDNQLERLRGRCRWTGRMGQDRALLDETGLLGAVQDADILLVGYEAVSGRVIREAPRLQLVGCARANPVNIDVAAATARGIPLIYTPGATLIPRRSSPWG